MKRITLLLALMVFCTTVFAQKRDLNSAVTKWNNYLTYDKPEGKVGDLAKSLEFIDKAIVAIKEKKAANDPKLKDKTVAKAYYYQGLIHSEMLAVDASSKAASAETAEAAFRSSMKADVKGSFKDKNAAALDQIRIAVYNKAIADFKAKQYEDAYTKFAKSLELVEVINTGSKEPVIDTSNIAMLAYAAQNSGKSEKAIEYYLKLKELKYDDAQIYNSLYGLYKDAGKDEEAAAVLKEGQERYPENSNLAIAEINDLLKEEGKQEEALGKMKKASELDPDNKTLHFAIGTTYYGQKMEEEAVASYKKALAIDSTYFDALYNLGLVYYTRAANKINEANNVDISEQDKYDTLMKESTELFNTALPFFEGAYKVNTEDVGTLTALKEIFAKTGDMDKFKIYKEKLESMEGGE